ncbi:Gfo/Idh/MocA family protein [Pedosphaera parvula]|uniref:Oxidoreductase domain protein n=1 Tax=Pedosphaera parvula (strain Ellin514) TaxID=320771 RepID=B9XRY1_PEDPL|nr:Gfo/Idh/MocA family oxidoreductase [Pedosphaera parvula]EEF57392.1 oxidoreductase domain protein [Pedosphaera parvula Ellin514]
MANTLRVGMIGYRFMGKAHSNAWRQAPHFFPLKANVELHTICGRDAANVEAARKQFGWQNASTDWRAVVNSPDIDIIDINTPNDSHAEIAIAAAKAGKHILCEKPLALNVKQCDEMVAAVKKAKVVNMVCHNYRRIPAIAQAKKMIEEGTLGEIYHYHARYAQDWIVNPDFPLVWRLQKGVSGSGTHGDINAHIIDLGRYLVGEFKEVCGLMHTFIKERPLMDAGGKGQGLAANSGKKMGKVTVDDTALFIGRFKNGAVANLEATRFALGRKNHIEIEINGSKGSLHFDFEDMNRLKFFDNTNPADRMGFRDILVTQGGGVHPYVGQWWPPGHIIGYEHTFVHTIADFINACVEGKSVQPTFEDGLKNERVLEAVEESAKKRQWVKV